MRQQDLQGFENRTGLADGTKQLDEYLSEIECDFILRTLEKSGNNKSKAAKLFGLLLSTLRTRMEKHNIPF